MTYPINPIMRELEEAKKREPAKGVITSSDDGEKKSLPKNFMMALMQAIAGDMNDALTKLMFTTANLAQSLMEVSHKAQEKGMKKLQAIMDEINAITPDGKDDTGQKLNKLGNKYTHASMQVNNVEQGNNSNVQSETEIAGMISQNMKQLNDMLPNLNGVMSQVTQMMNQL